MSDNYVRIQNLKKKDNPETWLMTFEDLVEINNLPDDDKLKIITEYLESRGRNWLSDSGFESWKEFEDESINRFCDQERSNDIWVKLWTVKKKKQEFVREYSDRVTSLKSRYKKATKKEQRVYALEEADFTKVYIKGLRPKSLRQYVKQLRPPTMKLACSIAEEYEEESSDSEDGDSSDEGGPSSGKNNKNMWNKSKGKISHATHEENTRNPRIELLIKWLDKLEPRLLQAVHATCSKTIVCYNCQGTGHQAWKCPEPCKYCKGSEGVHPYFRCKRYIAKKRRQEDPYAIKMIGQQSSDADQQVTRNVKRGLSTYQSARNLDHHQNDKGERIINIPKKGQIKESNDTLAIVPSNRKTDACDFINQKVFQVSLAQLADMSPALRAEMKKLLTKKQRNPRNKAQVERSSFASKENGFYQK